MFLALIAVFFALFGALLISKVFAENQDSADSVYLTIGGLGLVIGAIFGFAALLTASGSRPVRGWLVVAVVAFLASALPYTALVGTAGYAANGALGLLAIGAAGAYLRRPLRSRSTR